MNNDFNMYNIYNKNKTLSIDLRPIILFYTYRYNKPTITNTQRIQTSPTLRQE